ncbi:signal transduction histidine kinase/ActR/RegA family two-component response regulator [Massilia sp. MP_M2]|uniref:ATP-binding response regulator n=1 Tax=Massilia sp. MP_M2 TaxID=3071713 RepID=UPI00319EA130
MQTQFSGGTWRDGAAPPVLRYLFGLLLFLVALAARFMLVDLLPARGFPFLSFFPAVLLAAYLAGLGPGLLAAFLSTWAAWAFFMGPRLAPAAMAHSDLIALVFFALILVVDCLVIERMNLAMRKLRATGTRLRESEDALVARQAELSEANRQKDVFIAMLAHELRNPLAPILSAAQLIAMRAGDDAGVARAAAIIRRQGLQLTRLVDDLLDASRIHSDKLTVQQAPADLRDVIASALETSAPLIETSRSAFELVVPAQPIPVLVDSTRIAQCVSNLLHNAFKFTPEPGRISLHVSLQSDRTVSIRVTDTGRGISPDMLPRLFDMFTQEGRSGSDGNSGLGIGLALTRDLVLRHGGTLGAHSDGPGLGASFDITLPVSTEVHSAAASVPPLAPVEAPRHAPSVLVVDDNVDAAELLQALLGLHGFEVHIAHTGGAALAALADARYQVILLDIGLPDMTGYEVAIAARAQGLLDDTTYIVALTGWSDAASRQRSVDAGIDHHLNKPVQMEALLSLFDARILSTKQAVA